MMLYGSSVAVFTDAKISWMRGSVSRSKWSISILGPGCTLDPAERAYNIAPKVTKRGLVCVDFVLYGIFS